MIRYCLLLLLAALACKTTTPRAGEPQQGQNPMKEFPQDEATSQEVSESVGLPGSSCSSDGYSLTGSEADSQNPLFSFRAITDQLRGAAIQDICENSLALIFIGNGEQMGRLSFRGQDLPLPTTTSIKRQWEATALEFERSINNARKAFNAEPQAAFLQNSCLEVYRAKGLDESKLFSRNKMLVIDVADGPSTKDSSIRTILYSWQNATWSREEASHIWQGNLAPNISQEPFELNLPRSLSGIINQALDQYLPQMPDQQFDQVVYVIKSHGGLFIETDNPPSPLMSKLDQLTGRPVLLFDANGPKGALRSELYSPFWTKKSACKILTNLGRGEATDLNCPDNKAGLTGETAGIDGHQCNTAGTGKGMLFSQSLHPLSPMVSYEKVHSCQKNSCSSLYLKASKSPEGVIELGEALSYDASENLPQGVHHFRFRQGNSTKTMAADSIFLDSCYGMTGIKRTLERTAGARRKILTIVSQKPLYFHMFPYQSWHASDYLVMPYILGFDRTKSGEFPLADISELTLQTLSQGGLCGCHCSNPLPPGCQGSKEFKDCEACKLTVQAIIP